MPLRSSALVIECDDCVMQHTSACDDCLVTFVLSGHQRAGSSSAAAQRQDRPPADPTSERAEVLVLDPDEALAVGRLARAGLVPALRHEVAVP